MEFVAFDFETANEKRYSPCELAVCVVQGGQIVDQKSWLIRPKELRFTVFNQRVHGITIEDVKDKPEFCDLWSEIEPYFENRFVIAHNASFDINVLKQTLDIYSIKNPNLQFACTYSLSKKCFPGLLSYRLQDLSGNFGFHDVSHRSLDDTIACAQLANKIIETTSLNIPEYARKIGYEIGSLKNGIYQGFCKDKAVSADYKKYMTENKETVVQPSIRCNEDHIFFGKNFVFTGSLASMTRNQASEIVKNIGGNVLNSLKMETNFLVIGFQNTKVVGESGKSTKMKKAEEYLQKRYEIEVLSEKEFLELI